MQSKEEWKVDFMFLARRFLSLINHSKKIHSFKMLVKMEFELVNNKTGRNA